MSLPLPPLEAGITQMLTSDSVINIFIGGRVRPMLAAQLDVRPFLVYTVTGGSAQPGDTAGPSLSGPSGHQRVTVEFGLYGDSYTDCSALSYEIKRVFDGVTVNTNTVRVISVFDDETDIMLAIEPGKPAPVYVRSMTFRILYRVL